jgi:hypothetical protein
MPGTGQNLASTQVLATRKAIGLKIPRVVAVRICDSCILKPSIANEHIALSDLQCAD